MTETLSSIAVLEMYSKLKEQLESKRYLALHMRIKTHVVLSTHRPG